MYEDSDEILSFQSPKVYQHVIFSSTSIEEGETYAVLVNNTQVQQVTATDIVTTFNQGTTYNNKRS